MGSMTIQTVSVHAISRRLVKKEFQFTCILGLRPIRYATSTGTTMRAFEVTPKYCKRLFEAFIALELDTTCDLWLLKYDSSSWATTAGQSPDEDVFRAGRL